MSKPRRKNRHLPDTLTELVMVSGIGYLAAAYTASRWMTRPTPGTPRNTPTAYGLLWEPLTCRTTDGHRLIGWVVTPQRPKATVMLFHGIHNNREQTLSRLAFLVAAGYRCVAFDHRAHGESSGRRTSFGYYEGGDVVAILEVVRQRWPQQPRAALGISMGAAAVCYAAHQARALDVVILESLYQDIGKAFASRLNSYPPWFKPLGPGVVWVTERRLGLRVTQLAPVEHIANLAPTPILLLTGVNDPHASPADAHCLFERCRGPRELWLVPHAGHQDVFETGGKLYQDRILDFLERRLPAS